MSGCFVHSERINDRRFLDARDRLASMENYRDNIEGISKCGSLERFIFTNFLKQVALKAVS